MIYISSLLHISENDGRADTHNILLGNAWQVEFLYKNRETLKDIPIALEWHHSALTLAFERFEMISDRLLKKS